MKTFSFELTEEQLFNLIKIVDGATFQFSNGSSDLLAELQTQFPQYFDKD